jgi:Uma2 family endonuclease
MRTALQLTPKDHGLPLSLSEFERAGGQEGYRYELIDGRVQVSPIPDFSHEDLCAMIQGLLAAYAAQHPEVLRHVKSPARVFVPGRRRTTAPEPDVAAYRVFPTHLPRSRIRWQDLSPILVAEVLSADTADKDLIRNRRLYLQVPSIREYWIVDPRQDADHPSLVVHRRRGSRWQRRIEVLPGDTYTTPLLPGFVLRLSDPPAED